MLTTEQLTSATATANTAHQTSAPSSGLMDLLRRAYGVEFTILDGQSGDLMSASPDQPSRDWAARGELCREVARRGRPEYIDDEDPLLTLALPLTDALGNSCVAVATFITRPVEPTENLAAPAALLGASPENLLAWARRQTPWTPQMLGRVADLVVDTAKANRRAWELQREATSLSINIASTYEEISLLHRLTQNLKLSKSDDDLGQMALEWMGEVVPAAGLAIQLVPPIGARKSFSQAVRTQPVLLSHGDCPIDNAEFSALIAHLCPHLSLQPTVVNRPITGRSDWPFPHIRELILVALAEGENVFGWLAAMNHVEGAEFGTVEASLLSSVATILGIHGGNVELYRQQSDLLAGMVRSLSSAIDAKDPYTCGHSDRVARVAVRLAKELGCDTQTLSTLYLAGLLHDIGKIGVDDAVLRKPGRLSEDEYKHIKQHVNIGRRILDDLAKLENILPVVLHHHESWDGAGYPSHLAGDQIPLSARIVAVADAFDAMSSDRPYRNGLPDEKVDQTLRDGAGQQWDPEVVEAFFRARDDIRRICQSEGDPPELELDLDVVGAT
jgi:putative nucleotidyltransferase with HDIG domain